MRFQPGFDIDGVVKDTTGTFLRGLGLDPAQQGTWDFEGSFGPDIADKWRASMKQPCTWIADPLPGVVAGFAEYRLSQLWNPPFWITATPAWARTLSEWWMGHHFGRPWGSIIISQGRRARDKAEIARSLGITHFIEDSPRNANDMAEAGIVSYLVESPYRDEIAHHPDVILVPDFRAAVNRILHYEMLIKEMR